MDSRIYSFLIFSFLFFSCEQKSDDNLHLDQRIGKIKEVNNLEKTVVEYDSIYDAGIVAKGHKVNANFKFKNIGKNPWQIAEISPACGCTDATKAPEKAIAVGEEFDIKASIDTKNFKSNKFEKTVTVLSNCQEPVLILRIIGKLK